jgi:DNA-directed RNA polymerase delta subunit
VDQNAEVIAKAISGSLKIIEQDREREIISRRFGLSSNKETLEQIGDMLSITRERVRQLEKAILIRLRILAEDGNIPELAQAEKIIIRNLTEMGRIARVSDLAEKIFSQSVTEKQRQSLAFIGEISASLTVVEESEKYFNAIGIADYGSEKEIKAKVDEIVALIKKNKAPTSLDELDNNLNYEHPSHIKAIASISKLLATLNDLWGLAKWPTVNPKNIRDKIYVVLEEKREPMHFEEIAEAIKGSDFRRKNVTIQAIHNELIKDPRFVLIGRGIYALDSWGYKKGTVSETISDVLKQAKKPLSREQIVKRVLALRKVKETTILLNLQNKKLFKKVDKNSYTIAE